MTGPLVSLNRCKSSMALGRVRSESTVTQMHRARGARAKQTIVAPVRVLPPTIDPALPLAPPRIAAPISTVANLGKNLDVNEIYRYVCSTLFA